MEGRLNALRIGCAEPVFFREASVRPDCHIIAAAESAQFGEEPVTEFGGRLRS